MPSKFFKATQLGFYTNHLDFKVFILTTLFMINQMLIIKDPVHRPQKKMGL